ncbi:MAG: hypothetical protein RSD95_17395, partial [Clostridia bacterium]
ESPTFLHCFHEGCCWGGCETGPISIDAPCFLRKRRGVSRLRPKQVSRQPNRQTVLRGDFKAAVFFAIEKHSRLLLLKAKETTRIRWEQIACPKADRKESS